MGREQEVQGPVKSMEDWARVEGIGVCTHRRLRGPGRLLSLVLEWKLHASAHEGQGLGKPGARSHLWSRERRAAGEPEGENALQDNGHRLPGVPTYVVVGGTTIIKHLVLNVLLPSSQKHLPVGEAARRCHLCEVCVNSHGGQMEWVQCGF